MLQCQFSCHDLYETEQDSFHGMISHNKHSSITVLPSHCVDKTGQLSGFLFSTNPESNCYVLPINNKLFECICMFECPDRECDSQFNQRVLELFNDQTNIQFQLNNVVDIIKNERNDEIMLDCLPEESDLDNDSYTAVCNIQDSRAWRPSMPTRVGLYHAFVRNKQNCKREHKLYIVIRGGLTSVTEQVYNMWHDIKTNVSCADFVNCEELDWIREAVIRNHSRLAALISHELNLNCNLSRDYDLPGDDAHYMVKPTTITFINDIKHNKEQNLVHYVSGGCFTENSNNGILFDTLGVDGYWLFCGPSINSQAGSYGCQMRSTAPYVFPTVCAHLPQPSFAHQLQIFKNVDDQYVMLPDQKTLNVMEKMGFNPNDEIVHLMEIVSVYSNE